MNRRYDILRPRIQAPAPRTGLTLAIMRVRRLVARLFGRYELAYAAYPHLELFYRFMAGPVTPAPVAPVSAPSDPASARPERGHPLHHRVTHRHLHTIRFTGAAESARRELVGEAAADDPSAAPVVMPGRIERLVHHHVEREVSRPRSFAPSVERVDPERTTNDRGEALRVRDMIHREREVIQVEGRGPAATEADPVTTSEVSSASSHDAPAAPLEYTRSPGEDSMTVTHIMRRALSTRMEEQVLNRQRIRLNVRDAQVAGSEQGFDPVELTEAGGMRPGRARGSRPTYNDPGRIETEESEAGQSFARRSPLVHRRSASPRPEADSIAEEAVTPEVITPERSVNRSTSRSSESSKPAEPAPMPNIRAAVSEAIDDLSTTEVRGLAERVFDQLEKKLARERDRRGLR